MRSWPLLLLALAIPTTTSPARADDPAAARAQLEAGYALKEQGRYAEALPHLLESLRLDVELKTLTNLADCEEHLGKLVDAQKHWVLARDRAGVEGNDKLRAAAADKLAALEKRMPRLVVKLAAGSPEGAVVSRDGTQLGSISLGLPLPTDPGDHTLVVSAKAHLDATTHVTLAEAELKEVVVSAGADAPGAPGPIATGEVGAPPPAQGLGTQKTLAIVAAGVGAAGLVAGTITGAMAITQWGQAESDCVNGCSASSKAQTEKSHATTDATVSTIGFVAGAVLVAGGAALWLTAPKTKEAEPAPKGVSAVRRAPTREGIAVVPGACSISVLGVF